MLLRLQKHFSLTNILKKFMMLLKEKRKCLIDVIYTARDKLREKNRWKKNEKKLNEVHFEKKMRT